jgi:hypothetical protein
VEKEGSSGGGCCWKRREGGGRGLLKRYGSYERKII